MSKRSDDLLLRDIYVAVQRILTATASMDQAGFESNVIIQDAVIRNFEVIGEAAKILGPAKVKLNGFRNFLIHVYFGVDLSVLWNIIRNDIPVLELQINKIAPNA